MGRKNKLVARLKSRPKDFTFDEAKTLLELCGYVMINSGKTGGSRVAFKKGDDILRLHRPHPQRELLQYQIKEIIGKFEKEGLI